VNSSIIDLSHPLQSGTPVYPGDPPVVVTPVYRKGERGSVCNLAQVSFGLHAGTHLDAPFHFISDGRTVEQIPLERCIGEAILIPLPNIGAGAKISREDLAPHEAQIAETGRAVLNTGWNHRWGRPEFFTAHPTLGGDAARFLLDCGVHLLGVDFPAVDGAPYDAHTLLLGSDVLLVEGLTNLDAVPWERFVLIVRPLRLVGLDGSPVRAVAVEPAGLP
jgi:kynurenine formamidase